MDERMEAMEQKVLSLDKKLSEVQSHLERIESKLGSGAARELKTNEPAI